MIYFILHYKLMGVVKGNDFTELGYKWEVCGRMFVLNPIIEEFKGLW